MFLKRYWDSYEKVEKDQEGKNNDNVDKLDADLTRKDYIAIYLAFFQVFLPWILIFCGIFALLIFFLLRFWTKAG